MSEGVGFRVQGLGFEVLLFFGGLGLSRPSVISWGGGGGVRVFRGFGKVSGLGFFCPGSVRCCFPSRTVEGVWYGALNPNP